MGTQICRQEEDSPASPPGLSTDPTSTPMLSRTRVQWVRKLVVMTPPLISQCLASPASILSLLISLSHGPRDVLTMHHAVTRCAAPDKRFCLPILEVTSLILCLESFPGPASSTRTMTSLAAARSSLTTPTMTTGDQPGR